jgi:hypothetical protein
MANDSIVDWLQEWYQSQCNGDWEHCYTLRIETLDNPGWRVTIDLRETSLQSLSIPYKLVETSEEDWYASKVEDDKYSAHGDPTKLNLLLETFREIVTQHST